MTSSPTYRTIQFLSPTVKPPGKRRIASRACERCRRRKKRCFHLEHSETQASHDTISSTATHEEEIGNGRPRTVSFDVRGGTAEDSGTTPTRNQVESQAAPPPERSNVPHCNSTDAAGPSPAHVRFIGDLNPESALVSATSLRNPLKNSTGVWHNEEKEEGEKRDMFQPASLFHSISSAHRTLLGSFLQEQTFTVRPREHDFRALETFYLDHVYPILPCISLLQYRQSLPNTPEKIIQEQVICLLASTNSSMRRHLRLSGNEELLTPAEFAQKIVASMRLSIELALLSDRLLVIQALTAMSLMFYGRECVETTPQFFARAVGQGLTMGLHQPGEEKRDELVSGLFSYLWSIDRLQAAMHGRPIMMHTIDMAKSPLECARLQEPGFRVFVFISVLLDNVIALYRPNASLTEVSNEDFPSYEEILTECGALQLPARLTGIPTNIIAYLRRTDNEIATLELYYHAVAVLSCRQSSNAALQTRNTRQASSALQILSIMEDTPVEDLVILPFVPHAVSMSLSTAYRDWRHCQLSTHRSRARKRLARSYESLLPLCSVSWSAAVMAEMAGKVLQQTQNEEIGRARDATLDTYHRCPDSGEHRSGEDVDAQRSQGLDEPGEQRSADLFNPEMTLDDLDSILEASLDPQSVVWWH